MTLHYIISPLASYTARSWSAITTYKKLIIMFKIYSVYHQINKIVIITNEFQGAFH